MSYILDALEKSERARVNAAASSQPLLLRVDEEVRERRFWPYWVGALFVLNFSALYYFLRGPAGADAKSQAVSKVEAKAPAAANRAVQAIPLQPAPAAIERKADEARVAETFAPAPVVPIAPALPVRPPLPPIAADVTQPSAPPAITARPATVAALPATKRDAPVAPASATAAPGGVTPSATGEAVKQSIAEPAAGDVPEALRRELPPLAIGGVMREQGAAVLVVVNDRALREGEEVAPGLRVEKILEQGVQFSYKGYRFQRWYKL